MKKYPVAGLIALFALVLAMPCWLQSYGATPKAKATPTPHFHTVIGSVSADSITVQEPKGEKTFKIDKYTTITYDGNTVTAADLKPGMRVSVVPGMDPTVAEQITASEPPKDPAGSASPKASASAKGEH